MHRTPKWETEHATSGRKHAAEPASTSRREHMAAHHGREHMAAHHGVLGDRVRDVLPREAQGTEGALLPRGEGLQHNGGGYGHVCSGGACYPEVRASSSLTAQPELTLCISIQPESHPAVQTSSALYDLHRGSHSYPQPPLRPAPW